MKKANSNLKLGIFIVSAGVLALVMLLVFGGGDFFENTIIAETYFNETVQGLDVGSKVKFRGVKIGEVSQISFAFVKYQTQILQSDNTRYILVEMKINPRAVDSNNHGNSKKQLAAEVDRGFRVRMVSQGITGTMYLELDYIDPKDNPPLPIKWKPQFLYIPSIPSLGTKIQNTADAFLKRFEKLPVESVVSNLDGLLTRLNTKLDQLDVKTANTELIATLKRIRDLSDQDVCVLLRNLRITTENLRDLSETAKQYPSVVLFGEPPVKK